MILSDSMILKRIHDESIKFDPEVTSAQLQPASVDLRLGRNFRVFKPDAYACIDPSDKSLLSQITKEYNLNDGEYYVLHPGHFVLGTTLEYVTTPPDLVGRVEGRSSLGRLGIMVHVTAGFIDPGFEGHITLEFANVGSLPVKLHVGSRICQITYLECPGVNKPYGSVGTNSKYQSQRGPTASMGL